VQDQLPRPHVFGSELGPLDDIRNVEPLNVIDSPAAFADKMMVVFSVTFKACGVTRERDFPDQTSLHEGVQAVVDRCPGGPRIVRIDGPEYLVGGTMNRMPPEIFEENVPLRSTPQPARAERIDDSFALRSHSGIRILLIQDCVNHA
jgi:hypothetical protein